jgi:hypothetical protein
MPMRRERKRRPGFNKATNPLCAYNVRDLSDATEAESSSVAIPGQSRTIRPTKVGAKNKSTVSFYNSLWKARVDEAAGRFVNGWRVHTGMRRWMAFPTG